MILPALLLLAFQPPMLENDAVLVHMASDQPHSKTAVHHHDLDRVMIYLDQGRQRISYTSGKVDNSVLKPGLVLWSPAGGDHVSENVAETVLRIIEIELKPAPTSTKPYTISPLDPTKVDPKRYRVEFENAKVRVFRGTYAPHEVGVMHEHVHDRVVAYLKTGEIKVTAPDGTSELKKVTANTVQWGGPTKHQETIGDTPVEMVVVEFKNR
jgi:mannose-6-phosphate isomerase-like protein (cupin superfamily)